MRRPYIACQDGDGCIEGPRSLTVTHCVCLLPHRYLRLFKRGRHINYSIRMGLGFQVQWHSRIRASWRHRKGCQAAPAYSDVPVNAAFDRIRSESGRLATTVEHLDGYFGCGRGQKAARTCYYCSSTLVGMYIRKLHRTLEVPCRGL